MAESLLCGIRSDDRPQSGQDNRSSGDFTTQEAPSGTNMLRWTVEDSRGATLSGVTFNVMVDVSGGSDRTLYADVTNGSTTPYMAERQVYIANPGSIRERFFVSAFAIT
ncbi:hypothetical protein [Candidatus Entotheonella palauensis]|uniref:hypothetical protein n=1 Tax=Candidatus Entotheonella palauensis TaxID=93172 RepID=UPI000B7E4748|nr:hypothetical protein [Candidatus Entotheonella palauensis]